MTKTVYVSIPSLAGPAARRLWQQTVTETIDRKFQSPHWRGLPRDERSRKMRLRRTKQGFNPLIGGACRATPEGDFVGFVI